MTDKEIIQVCIRLKTLKPLLQALRFNAIKFEKLPRTPATYFAMKSVGGAIFFEHDIYFYTKLIGKFLDDMVFANDPGDTMKTKVENELRRINDGLRGM
ncbi:hypothetical protein B7N40_24160 [Salmonella enterica subsp. enterica serovar Bovismorbificans]|nr:hypothetical protein [Salmonella enterica subsp. enterica serovar Gatuni]EBW9290409.1 hypothetical protein [Salmonella enterica subsp. enterica serovar Bovismorbificans]